MHPGSIATTSIGGWTGVLVLVAGFGAGLFNGVAGGGTMLTFPTLLALGIPALTANMSSTIGIVPGYLTSVAGFGPHLSARKAELTRLASAALGGGVLGSALLLTTSAATFKVVVPYLVGAATVLFAVQPLVVAQLARRDQHRARPVAMWCGTFVASLYGGYFGAGMGIVLLVVFGFTSTLSLLESSGLRSVVSIAVNALAAGIFLLHGSIDAAAVAWLLPGSLLGGWVGAKVATRLPARWLRVVVVVVGITTVALLSTGTT